MTDHTILNTAMANLEHTAQCLADTAPAELFERLCHPHERIELTLSPQFDDGKIHVIKAFVVRHNQALGPAKGGIRMTPNVTLDDINGLAMEMTWKTALIGVPFGGGKSGIVADPKKLSSFNKETLVRSFARNAHRHIGPQIYVPAPDMGTNEKDMGHIKDSISYSAGQATTQGCYVTGKPLVLGGIPGRKQATGRGVAECAIEALKLLNIDPAKATAVIQGFGNVGSVAAQCLNKHGVTIIATGNSKTSIHNPNGIDIPALIKHYQQHNSLDNLPNTKIITHDQLLGLQCDLLIPAATENQINSENAPNIKAAIIAEGANSPTTPQADDILNDRGILVIPDILCNAGGVFVSYLEYTQETQQEQMTIDEVQTRLHTRICQKFHEVNDLAVQQNTSMRCAAMSIAVRAVCDAIMAHGNLP